MNKKQLFQALAAGGFVVLIYHLYCDFQLDVWRSEARAGNVSSIERLANASSVSPIERCAWGLIKVQQMGAGIKPAENSAYCRMNIPREQHVAVKQLVSDIVSVSSQRTVRQLIFNLDVMGCSSLPLERCVSSPKEKGA